MSNYKNPNKSIPLSMSKKFYSSNTIQFFSALLLAGGLDIILTLLNEETLDWRSVAIAIVSLIGIGLRLKTKDSIEM